MEKIEISQRLKAITEYISPYKNIADIGTDHCFVPIYLLQNNRITKAIATDLRDGPIQEAKKNVSIYQLEDKIEVRKGNGLAPIKNEDQIEVVIIAGMGGRLIRDILEQDVKRLKTVKRLILQPNKSMWVVREWLFTNSYTITNEKILSEAGMTYEIIVAEPIRESIEYTEDDILFGPFLRKEKNEAFITFWQEERKHKELILSTLPNHHPDRKRLETYIQQINEILN